MLEPTNPLKSSLRYSPLQPREVKGTQGASKIVMSS
jgi:hypothetical protein